jgi:hypothetical protein
LSHLTAMGTGQEPVADLSDENRWVNAQRIGVSGGMGL